jgi:FAD synthase
MNFKTFFLKEQSQEAVVVLPGGFKPPHKGHFEALKYLLTKSGAKQAKVFIGKKERDGITQDQSLKIWNIYKKYIPANVEVIAVTGADKKGREATPLSMTYDFIEDNKNTYSGFTVGAGEEDMSRFKGLEKDKNKYPNTTVIAIPPQYNRISGTEIRNAIQRKDKTALNFIPDEAMQDKDVIENILGI